MDEKDIEEIFALVRKENIRVNNLVDTTLRESGESSAISLCLNIGVNVLAQALLIAGDDHHRALLELFIESVAHQLKAGEVQLQADEVIRKAKGTV